jgi:hypothetical protein
MEEVLNSGMAFIGGLLEMATGRKLEPSTPDGRMLHVDPASGEVTLKFKLPGFGSNITSWIWLPFSFPRARETARELEGE